jgi:RNA polymerase sigma factor (sigma-70 family)
MDDATPVGRLVALARGGDEQAWRSLVERYSPLLTAVVSSYRLSAAARQDVVQLVWLRLVENLDRLRRAEALPQWLVTTARREALRQARAQFRVVASDPTQPGWAEQPGYLVGPLPQPGPEVGLLAAEQRQALLSALAELPEISRRLLALLVTDPTPSYAEVARQLGVPIGGIGPRRQRALAQLRSSPAVRAVADLGAVRVVPR